MIPQKDFSQKTGPKLHWKRKKIHWRNKMCSPLLLIRKVFVFYYYYYFNIGPFRCQYMYRLPLKKKIKSFLYLPWALKAVSHKAIALQNLWLSLVTNGEHLPYILASLVTLSLPSAVNLMWIFHSSKPKKKKKRLLIMQFIFNDHQRDCGLTFLLHVCTTVTKQTPVEDDYFLSLKQSSNASDE